MKNIEVREWLRQIPLFHDLNDAETSKIEQLLIQRSMVERMVIFMEDEPLEHVYFIASGKVKIYRTDEQGREQIVNLLEAGDMFPHIGFFGDKRYPAHAAMQEKGVLLALPIAKFRALLQSNPDFCLKLMAVMEREIMDLQVRLKDMVLHDTTGRIVSALLRFAKQSGETLATGQVLVRVPLNNQEIANMIGTSRETVSRTLSQFRKIGLLETTPEHHLLLDVKRLEEQLL